LAGPKIKNLHASKLASDFQPFDPGIIYIEVKYRFGRESR